jgi:hypothetical protein
LTQRKVSSIGFFNERRSQGNRLAYLHRKSQKNKMSMKGFDMKKRLAVLLTGLTCLLAASVTSRAAVGVSFSAGIEINSANDFYEPLTPYGEWVSVGSYGRCWHPQDVDVGWRPYCAGHWEWTDCGWYWVSEEPWSWATYHYGSWVDDPRYGWCWLPGTEWAPSWVTWREAPDYIGWAPCGPGGAVLAPSLFVFVDTHHFSEPIRPNTVIVNNTTIINRTRVINDIQRVDRDIDGSRRRVVVNQGPKVDVVAKATGRTFTPQPVREVVRQTPVPEQIKRTGTIERPVLKEDRQKIEQRQRQRNTGTQEQRQRTPSPTGREQPGNNQRPEQQRPDQVRPDQRPTPSTPERRDQVQPENRPSVPQRPEQARPEQRPTPNTPERREQTQPQQRNVTPTQPVPPTGRDQPRVTPPEQRTPVPQKPEQTRPEQRPAPPAVEHRDQVQPQQRDRATPQPEQRPSVPNRSEQVRPERTTPQPSPERVVPPTGREVPKEQPKREQQPAVREQPKEVPHPQQPSVKEVPQPQERQVTPPSQERGRSQESPGHEKKDKSPD